MSIDVSEESSRANHWGHSHQNTDLGGAMNDLFGPESRRELLQRGFSRRDFGRIAALLTAGGSLPFYNESVLAQGLSALPSLPPDAVRLNANENPMGPCLKRPRQSTRL